MNVVVDSLRKDHLRFRGATGLILAAEAATYLGCDLRVVVRTWGSHQGDVLEAFRYHQVDWTRNIEFAHCHPRDLTARLDVSSSDIFVTTSWWTTATVMQTVPADRWVYVIQDDERARYPLGHQSLRAAEVMRAPSRGLAVETRALFDHLVADGFEGLEGNGTWFEPAYPMAAGTRKPRGGTVPRSFVFVTDPHDPASLHQRGVDALTVAVARGVLDPRDWSLTFLGPGLRPLTLAGSVSPRLVSDPDWDEWAAILSSADAAMSFCYGPRRNYTTDELDARGAVVVTDRYGPKAEHDYARSNLIAVDVDRDSIVTGIELAVARVVQTTSSQASQPAAREHSWRTALGATVERLFRDW